MRATLEPEGYVVQGFTAAEAALKHYGEHADEVDLVLLDFLMPDMNGELMFECLQDIKADVRVVLLTGCDDRVAQKMFERGLKGLIRKPFFLEDFKAEIRQHLLAD